MFNRHCINGTVMVLVAAAFSAWVQASAVAAGLQPTVTRKVLRQEDLNIPGYSTALVAVEFPVGSREGRHTHPGTLVAYVQEGTVTLDYEGKPTVTYQAGEAFSVEPGKVHEGINNGSAVAKILAAFVVEKGKPISSPAK